METANRNVVAPVDRGLLNAQIEQCYLQLPISLVVGLVNAVALVVVLWGAVATPSLLVWCLLLALVTSIRLAMLRDFRHAILAGGLDCDIWRHYFLLGACAAGLVWGSAGILLFHPTSFPHQVFLAFVLGGMVAGAIPLLSAVDGAYRCFAIPVFLPIGARLLLAGDRVHVIMGLMVLVFGLAMLASAARIRRLFHDTERLRHELSCSIETGRALEQMVRRDPLTGIANRRLFEEVLDEEWRRARRNHECLAVISADIDHFKQYNDHYGHPAGDECLIQVAQGLAASLSRPGDVVARIGGEEFAFLLPRTSLSGAITLAQMARRHVHELGLPHAASPVAPQVTLSFGVAISDSPSVSDAADLLRASDRALYDAKRRGRDRIAVFEMRSIAV